jgi:RNA polymerase sigma-70 factor (ECF subfamily)
MSVIRGLQPRGGPVKEDDSRGVEDAGERAGISEAEHQERLTPPVLRTSKLSPDEAARLEEEFPGIVAAHRELVASILRSHGVKSHEVDDLSQEVFIALHNQILEERSLRSIPAMLNVIASRRAIDHRRTQACAPFSSGLPSSSSEPVPRSQISVESALHIQEVARRIFSQLSPEHKEVVDKVFRKGMTHTEAAAALGIPEGTLKTRLIAAKRALVAAAEPFQPPSQRGPL